MALFEGASSSLRTHRFRSCSVCACFSSSATSAACLSCVKAHRPCKLKRSRTADILQPKTVLQFRSALGCHPCRCQYDCSYQQSCRHTVLGQDLDCYVADYLLPPSFLRIRIAHMSHTDSRRCSSSSSNISEMAVGRVATS